MSPSLCVVPTPQALVDSLEYRVENSSQDPYLSLYSHLPDLTLLNLTLLPSISEPLHMMLPLPELLFP